MIFTNTTSINSKLDRAMISDMQMRGQVGGQAYEDVGGQVDWQVYVQTYSLKYEIIQEIKR